MSALTLRGEFYVANPEPFDPAAVGVNAATTANAMVSLGNVSKFTLEPASERTKMKDWMSGNEGTFETWNSILGGKIKLLAEESNAFNLSLNLAGRLKKSGPVSVSGAKIAVRNTTTQKWSELTAATPLKASTSYYFVNTIVDDGLSYDAHDWIDTSTFVLTDSSSPAKTLIKGTDYTIFGQTGQLRLKTGTGVGINKANLTYPLTASFDTGAFADTLPMPLAAGSPYALGFRNISDAALVDSSAPPKTIPLDFYTIDTAFGMVRITDLPAIKAIADITFPLKVVGMRGNVQVLGLFTAPTIVKQVRLNGINIRTKQQIVITLWRVSFDATAVDFFDKDYAKTPLEGELMIDPSRPVDDVLGQYGIIEYL